MNELTIAEMLRTTRRELDLSASEVARAAGVDLQTLAALEKDPGRVALSKLLVVLQVLGVTFTWAREVDDGEYTTVEDIAFHQFADPADAAAAAEWAALAYRLGRADALMSVELREGIL